jgi:hypothetical protein
MTLDEQISLIEQMFRENPDYTIRDYLDLMSELKTVSDSLKIKRHPTQSENGPFIFHQSINNNGTTAPHRKTDFTLRFYSH